jgi:small subunit ribosomal protein S3
MGRAFRVLKRTAHLTVHVSERPEKVVPVRPARGAAASARAGRAAKKRRGAKARLEEGEGVTVGQKVHPFGFRLGFNKTWRSRWYSDRDYAKLLHEDSRCADAEEAVRARRRLEDRDRARRQQAEDRHLHLAAGHHHRPQGHGSRQAEAGDPEATSREVFINIQEIQKPELDAQLISESVAMQLEKRVAFRRAMRKAVESALRFGARGIKVRVSGRLNGAEIARSEWYLHGQLPLQTLRADIDYGFAEANTTYGQIGIKVWLYKGERLVPLRGREEEYRERARAGRRGGQDGEGRIAVNGRN